MARFSDNELRMLTYNAMARSSEAGAATIYRLGLAANAPGGIVQLSKYNNSGYTIGTFQVDFGASPDTAQQLVAAYNDWAKPPHTRIANQEEATHALQLHGRYDKDQNPTAYLEGRQDIRTTGLGRNLNAFLASEAGIRFSMPVQEKHYQGKLQKPLTIAMNSVAVQRMNDNDARITLAVLAKVINQTGNPQGISTLLQQPNTTKQMVLDKIATHPSKDVREGTIKTVHGTELFNTLTHDRGRLGQIFRHYRDHDPSLMQTGFRSHAEAQLLDTMFRFPDKAQHLVKAFNEGKAYSLHIPSASKIRDEAYSVGVTGKGELYSVDQHGKGFVAGRDGVWHQLNDVRALGVEMKAPATPHQDKRVEAELPTNTLAERPELQPLESKLLSQAYKCLRADHNQGRFDQFDATQQENIAGAAMRGAMDIAGNPRLNIQDFNHIFLSENGNMYIGMGKLDMSVNKIDITQASQTPLVQSVDMSRQENQQLLDSQQRELLARNQAGPSGPTLSI